MAKKVPFKNWQIAYDALKSKLPEKGYEIKNFKKIQHGIQFFVSKNGEDGLVRIYDGKKRVKVDVSQIKHAPMKKDILNIPYPESGNVNGKGISEGKIYSLCIGINTFPNFQPLKYADKDAEELNLLLVDTLGYGEGVIKLTNEQATSREITNSLEKIRKLAKPEDTLLVFIATHGEFRTSGTKGEFYIITADSDIDNLPGTAISMEFLRNQISEIPTDNKVIFLDTCHSGGICARDSEEANDEIKKQIFNSFSHEDFVIITSCLATEKSFEFDELEHGVFSYYLLSGLTGAVETENDRVDLYLLYAYINKFVKKHVKSEKNRNQTPRFLGNFKGPIYLPKLKSSSRKKSSEHLPTFTKRPLDNNEVKVDFETFNCVGIDESGKGDYFGPLVVAAVYVDTDAKIAHLKSIGVKDSKKIDDSKINIKAKQIMRKCDNEIVWIGPSKYNHLYSEMGNLNELVAWAHAQSLERILERNPECDLAVSDQFAAKDVLINKLKEKGKKIQLIQRPKAEENIAVAAASILARYTFIGVLDSLGKPYNQTFPKGASDIVVSKAAEFVKKGGNLRKVAKFHFKTTEKVNDILSRGKNTQ